MGQSGSKHDTYHRDLDAPSTNRDVAFVDHLIDTLVAEGVVDPDRIYTTGHSNGARFASMYAIARHETASAGGNRVAAAAVYSGGDPFENIREGWTPSCRADPYPTSTLPHFLISRTCDGVACSEKQYEAFLDEGMPMTPGNCCEAWVETLRATIGSPVVEWQIVSGMDHEPLMLDFLRTHAR
jgi:dienelactone hydrolase